MTLRWLDGFDHYGSLSALLLQGPYAQADGASLVTTPRSGVRALRLQGGGLRRVFNGSMVEGGVGYAFSLVSLPSSSTTNTLAAFRDADNYSIILIMLSSAGEIIARRNDVSGPELGRSLPVIYTGSYQHIEMALNSEVSGGSIEVRVNSVTVLNLTGLDTRTHNISSGTGTAAPAQVLINTGGPGSAIMIIDDLFCWDADGAFNNTFLGDKKVYTVFPDADTAQEDWVPSVGTDSYQMLNNNPPVDTDYLTAAAAGASTIVGLADLPPEIVSISGVMTASRMWKSDAGFGSVAVSIISAGTPETGLDHSLSMAPTYYHDVFEVDPDTGAPWTLSGFNAAQYEIDRTT